MSDAPRRPAAAPLVCAVTGQPLTRLSAVRLDALRPALAGLVRADHPGLAADAVVAPEVAARYRMRYVEDILKAEHGELSRLDRDVAASLASEETISAHTTAVYDETRSFGERLSDGMARFGGSWTFLIVFGLLLAGWMAANAALGASGAFDPFPFILLNLILSCLAAVQAPIIMMSQRRQEEKDRLRAENDYRINLKAELEIRHLHEKIDHLLMRQWERLAEIQEVQIEMLQDRAARGR